MIYNNVIFKDSDDGVTTSFQRSRNSRPPMLDHQDKYMMKAEVHVSKSSAISGASSFSKETLLSNLSSGKAYIKGEIVSKAFKISSMRVATQESQGGMIFKNNDIKIKI
nr:hypothetical protein [Tanacetum cinerariifolium]